MADFLNVAAEWLEHGRPGERAALAEAAEFGSLLWSAGGVRAYGRQGPDGYRLSLVGAGPVLAYEAVGVDGGWLR